MQLRTLAAGIVLAFSAMSAAHAQPVPSLDLGVGSYVYVMSNDIKANSVAVLRRNFFGGLDKVQVTLEWNEDGAKRSRNYARIVYP